jgi:hypothetical protein
VGKFGLAPVFAPPGSGRGTVPAETVRDTLRAAFPGPRRAAA